MRGLAVVALAGVLVAGCSDQEELPSDTRAPVVSVTTVVPPPVTVNDADSLDGVTVDLELVATLEAPTAMAFWPGDDGTAYVTEQAGRVQRVGLEDGAVEEAIDIHSMVSSGGERGLLGLAFSPDGGFVYLSYTQLDGDSRIDEYAVGSDGAIDAGSRRPVFALDQPFPNHNGGDIVFGPDGLLYVGFGDGGSQGDPLGNGQNRGALLASILRIDPRGSGGSAYAVPDDNPYVGVTGARPEVWIKGVRNPWRFSFDLVTGDLWIADVGGDQQEEIDLLPAGPEVTGAGRGANLGWNLTEGDVSYSGDPPEDWTPPVLTYTHDDGGCSVVGGYAYRGSALDGLQGAFLYTDYCLGDLRAVLVHDGEVLDDRPLGPTVDAPTSFGQDPAGELYVLSQSGPISRLVPA